MLNQHAHSLRLGHKNMMRSTDYLTSAKHMHAKRAATELGDYHESAAAAGHLKCHTRESSFGLSTQQEAKADETIASKIGEVNSSSAQLKPTNERANEVSKQKEKLSRPNFALGPASQSGLMQSTSQQMSVPISKVIAEKGKIVAESQQEMHRIKRQDKVDSVKFG